MNRGHLKSLDIWNFLSYEEAHFDFHPGVNMLIGVSDKGKSAMMDALRKLMYNRPLGDEFVSWWGGKTQLILKADNWSIEYWKEKSKAGYIIDMVGNDQIKSTAGTAVPEDVTRLLNMSRELNIQRQLERKAPIWLLSETPGDAAKLLNRIAELDGIDTTIQAAKEDINSERRATKVIEKQIKAKEDELTQYQGLDSFNLLLAKAETTERMIHDLDSWIDNLEMGISYVESLKEKKVELDKWMVVAGKINMVEKIQQQITRDEKKLIRLERIGDSLQLNRHKVNSLGKILVMRPKVKRCHQFTMIISQYDMKYHQLLRGLGSLLELRGELKKTIESLGQAKTEFKSKFPDICPLCSSKVERDKLC